MAVANETPAVSIVIATYNHARFLGDAIASAVFQHRPLEVIVVDDGSTDYPESVVRRFSSASMIRQKNTGLAAARNTGLAASTGGFILFLDADDRLLPNAVTDLLKCFEENPEAGLVYGTYRTIDVRGKVITTPPLRRAGSDPYVSLLAGNLIGMSACVLYRRHVLTDVGGFDLTLKSCEDWEMYLRAARSVPFGWTEALIAEYRQHGRNKSRDHARVLRAALKGLEKHRRFTPHYVNQTGGTPDYGTAEDSWKQFYAMLQVRDVGDALRNKTWSLRLLWETAKMARLAPGHLVRGLRHSETVPSGIGA